MLPRFKYINWQCIQKIKYPKYIDKPCQQSQGTPMLEYYISKHVHRWKSKGNI